jgi:hypothetical protein
VDRDFFSTEKLRNSPPPTLFFSLGSNGKEALPHFLFFLSEEHVRLTLCFIFYFIFLKEVASCFGKRSFGLSLVFFFFFTIRAAFHLKGRAAPLNFFVIYFLLYFIFYFLWT